MGLHFSCPISDSSDLDPHFDSDNMKKVLRSISFNSRDLKPSASKRILFEGSLSFNGRGLETKLSFRGFPLPDEETTKINDSTMRSKKKEIDHELRNSKIVSAEELTDLGNKHHQAALKLQKVYKSFRTRRQLADCAVIVEQKWWKLLDFAELKRSSISFFDIEKPETAISRWSRARTRAAKVGKGLSKDEKARQLALQHWLEAIDPRHRYGHNLQFYYAAWLHCDSRQPFFYWLDIGEGKEVNIERCSRSKLLQQCIKYLGPTEREGYEVVIEKGRLLYKESGKVLDTTGSPKDSKWIFVLSVSKTLYVGLKEKGKFQHSSFLAGGATLSAGRLVVDNGVLKAIWPHSGHYLPTEENFEEFMLFLKEHSVDLTDVQKSPTEDDEEEHIKKLNSISNGNYQKDEGISEYVDAESDDTMIDLEEKPVKPRSNLSKRLCPNLTSLELPNSVYKSQENFRNLQVHGVDSPSEDGYETAEEGFISEEEFIYPKANLFGEEGDERDDDEDSVPKEKIMKRIDSHKGMKSYQLGQQLSSRWTTGAGARISCMRDYPSELQFRVLEQANLSPRKNNSSNGSPSVKNGNGLRRSLLAEEEA